MSQSVATVFLILMVVALLPAVLLWGLLRLTDYIDDKQVTDLRRFERDGPHSEIATETTGAGLRAGSNERRSEEAAPDRSPTAITASQTVTCSECGRENDAQFDRCWNCVATL